MPPPCSRFFRTAVLPLSPGRAERHGFEYYRHGTLSLYAALDVKTGAVHGMTAARHTSREFITFLKGLVERAQHAREIHVVLDNLSAHKTKEVEQFLTEHPRVRFHFTPTYSSWLNQLELWFAKIQRDVIARGVFTSVADLGNKLRKYIRAYSKSAQPFRWTYTDPSRRIVPNKNRRDLLLVGGTSPPIQVPMHWCFRPNAARTCRVTIFCGGTFRRSSTRSDSGG